MSTVEPAFLRVVPPGVFYPNQSLRITVCKRKLLPHRYQPRRGVIIANSERLYPEPDEEKPQKETPSQPMKEGDVEKGPGSFFDRLNEKSANKRGPTNSSTTPLTTDEQSPISTTVDTSVIKYDYTKAAMAFWRIGWVTWWLQLILTVIAGVILLFAFAFPGVNVRTSASALGFILSGIGVFLAFVSLFWTYSYTRLSLWLREKAPDRSLEAATAKVMTRLRLGTLCAIVGLIISLVGLQAIVGTLLARLFSSGVVSTPYTAYQNGPAAGGSFGPGANIVQPIDILVVQAAANAMMALLAALTSTSWFRSRTKTWLLDKSKAS